MAIIDELGLEVKILVDGREASEYHPDETTEFDGDGYVPSTKKCYRYVESKDEAHFAIQAGVLPDDKPAHKWLQSSKSAGLQVNLSIDGEYIPGFPLMSDQRKMATCKGVSDRDNGLLRKFRFASVSTGGL